MSLSSKALETVAQFVQGAEEQWRAEYSIIHPSQRTASRSAPMQVHRAVTGCTMG